MTIRPPLDAGAVHVTNADTPVSDTPEILGALGVSGNTMLSVVADDCPTAFTARTPTLNDWPGFRPAISHFVASNVASTHEPCDAETV